MRNLIIFLLFFNSISSQNLVTREVFGNRNTKGWNTFIGGVSSTISTSAQLATKLGISNNRIRNFVVVGSDIKCRIIGSYTLLSNNADGKGFRYNNNLTYFYDYDNLLTGVGNWIFTDCANLTELKIEGVTSFFQYYAVQNSPIQKLFLPNITSVIVFTQKAETNSFYIPLCVNLGGTVGDNTTFENITSGTVIYANPALATNNAGTPDGDITYAISRGATVRYVTNFTPPNPITSLATGTITTTSIQFNFTNPTGSTNAYDFSEIYKKDINGNWLYISEIASGGIVSGLTTGTTYDFKIVARDIFYNGAESFITASTL